MIKRNKDIIKLPSVTSTNDFAKELLLGGIPETEITIISAYEQSKGRGQKGNVWEAEPGKNITISILVKPSFLQSSQQFFISMVVSLSIVDCLSKYIKNVSVKWPNDIYVGNNKICGILIENRLLGDTLEASTIGIGLNVNQTNFSHWIPNPTSFFKEYGKEFSIEKMLNELISSFENQYERLIINDFESIHKDYLKQLYLINIPSKYKDIEGEFIGKIVSVDHNGILIMQLPDIKIKQYAFKELEYLPI